MTRKTLIIDTQNCVGCLACEVACKQEHDTDIGPRWIRVHRKDPEMIEGRLQLRYNVACCVHCDTPACRDVCPDNAITKRDDGVVLINNEACSGCAACVEACPFGVMQFDTEKNVAQKCDLCVNRTDLGLPPACAAACVSHCVHFGDINELIRQSPELSSLLQSRNITD